MSTEQEPAVNGTSSGRRPLTIGVFGGSFNPIHLGHALLAITTQQTKAVDAVVLVPVYKHAVKRDLLPFEDRVNMCRLAVETFGDSLSVSTIEEQVGASNGEMLKALKKEYPVGTRFLWICGDDFVRWMDKPKGIETLEQVSGIILQRRLHKTSENEQRFFKEPLDDAKIQRLALQLDLQIDFIYGELPHFSSTLVRRAPGHWRSFLTQSVAKYLDERPHLLTKLIANLEADAERELEAKKAKEKPTSNSIRPVRAQRTRSILQLVGGAAACVLRGLDVVHALQKERGRTGLYLSTGTGLQVLQAVQAGTDDLLVASDDVDRLQQRYGGYDEVLALAKELQRIPDWLEWDRHVLKKRSPELAQVQGTEGWLKRLAFVEKFNPRIDVLIGATVRALVEILENSARTGGACDVDEDEMFHGDLPELLFKWWEGKEALGRLRAFVCAGGPTVPALVRQSFQMRERLSQTIETKERCIARVLSLEAGMSSRLSAPDALHKMLENVTRWELTLMGCFAPSTPLPLVHSLLGSKDIAMEFDVEKFFDASSSAIDFLLIFARALTASVCARA